MKKKTSKYTANFVKIWLRLLTGGERKFKQKSGSLLLVYLSYTLIVGLVIMLENPTYSMVQVNFRVCSQVIGTYLWVIHIHNTRHCLIVFSVHAVHVMITSRYVHNLPVTLLVSRLTINHQDSRFVGHGNARFRTAPSLRQCIMRLDTIPLHVSK